jgi:hypothetical protein
MQHHTTRALVSISALIAQLPTIASCSVASDPASIDGDVVIGFAARPNGLEALAPTR